MKKIAYLNDTWDCYHWGCTATSGTVKEMLQERGYVLECAPHRVLATIQNPPGAWDDYPAAFDEFARQNPTILEMIERNDMVVVNGEGTPHTLSHGPRVLLYLMYLAKQRYGKKVHIVNHSCYPNDHQTLPDSPESQLYRQVYRLLDFVAVREHKTHAVLKAMGIDAVLAFDNLPLYVSRHYPKRFEQRKKQIIVATSSRIHYDQFDAIIAYLADKMAEGYAVVGLSGAAADPAEDEIYFMGRMQQALAGFQHVVAPTLEAWLDVLGESELLVSGRYHYTIAAAVLGTPCVVFDANTPKNLAVCEDMGLPAPLSYLAENLREALHERTRIGLQRPWDPEAIATDWTQRALKNYLAF